MWWRWWWWQLLSVTAASVLTCLLSIIKPSAVSDQTCALCCYFAHLELMHFSWYIAAPVLRAHFSKCNCVQVMVPLAPLDEVGWMFSLNLWNVRIGDPWHSAQCHLCSFRLPGGVKHWSSLRKSSELVHFFTLDEVALLIYLCFCINHSCIYNYAEKPLFHPTLPGSSSPLTVVHRCDCSIKWTVLSNAAQW